MVPLCSAGRTAYRGRKPPQRCQPQHDRRREAPTNRPAPPPFSPIMAAPQALVGCLALIRGAGVACRFDDDRVLPVSQRGELRGVSLRFPFVESKPSSPEAQGEQRRSFLFNILRDNPVPSQKLRRSMIDPDRDHDPNRPRIDDTISAALGLPSLAVIGARARLKRKRHRSASGLGRRRGGIDERSNLLRGQCQAPPPCLIIRVAIKHTAGFVASGSCVVDSLETF
jgi:hypothetical protein